MNHQLLLIFIQLSIFCAVFGIVITRIFAEKHKPLHWVLNLVDGFLVRKYYDYEPAPLNDSTDGFQPATSTKPARSQDSWIADFMGLCTVCFTMQLYSWVGALWVFAESDFSIPITIGIPFAITLIGVLKRRKDYFWLGYVFLIAFSFFQSHMGGLNYAAFYYILLILPTGLLSRILEVYYIERLDL